MNYRKVNRFWQSCTLLLAPILLTLLILFRGSLTPWMWLLSLHLPFLMLHEAEEYVLSPLSFKDFINTKSPLSVGLPEFPLDEGYVFQVNLVLAWPVIILGAALANVAPWIGMAMVIFEIVINNATHTVAFQGSKPSYNPGLVTNCAVLVPYSVVALVSAARFFSPLDWVLSVLLGAGICAFFALKTGGRMRRAKAEAR